MRRRSRLAAAVTALLTLPITVAVVSFAISNRAPVELALWPLPATVTLPLYLVTLGLFLLGFLVGALAVWLAGTRARIVGRRARRRVDLLERELVVARRQALARPSDRDRPELPRLAAQGR